MANKKCSKCGEERYNYTIPYCKLCWNAYCTERRKKKIKKGTGRTYIKGRTEEERYRDWYSKHREEHIARARAWQAANPDKVKAMQEKYRQMRRR